jgi:hypothetical protein
MAIQIGGTIATPSTSSLLTWASVRAPLVLYDVVSLSPPLIKQTTYSRTYPSTTGDDYPKFFIWESGSLFSWKKGNSAVPPYYYIEMWYKESTDEYGAMFSVGFFPNNVDLQVDNLQFSELIGAAVTSDILDFTITIDAHSTAVPRPIGQFILEEDIEDNPRILTIGKLDPV